MTVDSISKRTELLEATARRFRERFGASTDLGHLAEATSATGQRTWRPTAERRSAAELLSSNPPKAVVRRLRRLGVSASVAQRVVDGSPALEGRFEGQDAFLERVLGRNDLLGINYLDAGRVAAQAVARVVIRSSSDETIGFGTGSMISPSLLMTNNHVLGSEALAGRSLVEFNYQLGQRNEKLAKVSFRLRPDVFFVTSGENELDVTVVAVEEGAGSSPRSFGFNPLTFDEGEILAGENVTIIQHPGGDLKKIALRENRVLSLPNPGDEFLYYETDTSPGSSGAPVFNDQWEVVALHHSGVPERDAQDRILTTDGRVWLPSMGDDRIHWIANEGIRVVAIRDFLFRLTRLKSSQAALRDEALHPPTNTYLPSKDTERRGTESSSDVSSRADRLAADRRATASAGVAVWSIPLTISVSVGGATLADSSLPTVVSPAPVPPGTPVRTSSPPDLSREPEPEESDFDEAKRLVAEATHRKYFDAPADSRSRDAYYADLDGSLSSAKLFDALSQLLKRSHAKVLPYKPAVHLYPWVDLQPGGSALRSVYSDQTFDPIAFIERDREVFLLRRERLESFRANEAVADPTREAAYFESLEAQLPYNCEHVVPQSWFAKRQPMRGDLHHLFACESRCNSFRSNTPYFDFADFREAIRSDCGKSVTNKFEPNSGKGAVARATLYFLLRYPGEINAVANEYAPERLAILLDWHREHPVGDYERHRNQAIFAAQGNRNPLIDFPEWAESIDFARGLG